jgi:hypothetical protein
MRRQSAEADLAEIEARKEAAIQAASLNEEEREQLNAATSELAGYIEKRRELERLLAQGAASESSNPFGDLVTEKAQRRLREVQETIDFYESFIDGARAREADAIEAVYAVERAATIRRIEQQEQQALVMQARARRGMEAELVTLRLRNAGRVDEAQVAAIRRDTKTRMEAAEAVGDAEQVRLARAIGAEREAVVRRETAERQRAEQEQRAIERGERLRSLAYDRVDAARAEQRALSEQVLQVEARLAAERAPFATLNQDRFLTGVSEQTEADDRERLRPVIERRDELGEQLAVAERQVAKMDELVVHVGELTGPVARMAEAELRGEPLVVGGLR